MTATELIANIKIMGTQDLHVFLHYLADHLYEAELTRPHVELIVPATLQAPPPGRYVDVEEFDQVQVANTRLRDAIDFKHWLQELAEAARNA